MLDAALLRQFDDGVDVAVGRAHVASDVTLASGSSARMSASRPLSVVCVTGSSPMKTCPSRLTETARLFFFFSSFCGADLPTGRTMGTLCSSVGSVTMKTTSNRNVRSMSEVMSMLAFALSRRDR